MAGRSPFSDALHAAFDRELFPLLARLGFSRSKIDHVRPGNVVASARRPLDAERYVEAALWCDAATGAHLSFRLDVVAPGAGALLHHEVKLPISTSELAAHESPTRLELAIAYVAGTFAANAERLANAAPELAPDVRRARETAEWKAAASRAKEIWETRHVRGAIDDRAVPAKVVFVGAKLLVVEAEGTRVTFHFDTANFDRSAPAAVSGWFTTPAGTRSATKLTNGTRSWSFDFRGHA
ncbi:MAG TPA: hypothetical protein VGH28_01100 [Polyangiaceae bacterium]|jgi:hypothetical protein